MVNLRQTVLLATLAVLLIAQVAVACQCGQGVDVCNCQPRETVRPRPLPVVACRGPRRVCQYVGGTTQYSPIGDVCSCTSTAVRPAPRPRSCGSSCNCGSCGPAAPDNSENRHRFTTLKLYSNDAVAPASIPLPIDAVSFDLARKMHRQMRNQIPEKFVAFGHLRTPQDAPNVKTFRDVPEDQLFAIDKTVIELKRPIQKQQEIIEESSEETGGDFLLPKIGGYQDFGYKNAVFEERNFRIRPLALADDTPDCNKPKAKENCGCRRDTEAVDVDSSNFWNYLSSNGFLSGSGAYSYSS